MVSLGAAGASVKYDSSSGSPDEGKSDTSLPNRELRRLPGGDGHDVIREDEEGR